MQPTETVILETARKLSRALTVALDGGNPENAIVDALIYLQLHQLCAQQEAALEVPAPVDKEKRDAAVRQNLTVITEWIERIEAGDTWWRETLQRHYSARNLLEVLKTRE